jgi:hypothetical protein
MEEEMARNKKWLALVGLVSVLAFLAACGDNDTPSAGGTNSPTTPAKMTFDEPEWTIETPAGWTREDVTANADAKKAIRYKASNGDYVIVHIDPLGSDFAYDALWRYSVKGSGFEIGEKYECKGTLADEQCSDDDTRYDGFALWRSGETPQKVGGHTWYFAFGNTTTTTVDLSLYEQVLESVRVKG